MRNLFVFIIILLKEILEYLHRKFFIAFYKDSQYKKIVNTLNEEGIFIEENFLTKEKCKEYIEKIDHCIAEKSNNIWVDLEGSDHRVYFINELEKSFNDFLYNKKILTVLKNYLGIKNPCGMLLGAKIKYVKHNKGSGDGWHRDSPVTNQFKTICYLNDVSINNGPFQYIKKSHRKKDVLKSIFNKFFRPGAYRFSDNEIDLYLKQNKKSITSFTANAGSLAYVDTKGIHRGMPLEEGYRYVLFCYFWRDKLPLHFEKLKQ